MVLCQKGDGFRISFGLIVDPSIGQFGAQLAKVFNDAVMDDGHMTGLVRMCIAFGRGAVGGPAGVPDPGLACQRFMHQLVAQVCQLAHRAAAIQCATVYSRDTSAVIAAILQPFQRFNEDRCNLVIAQYTNNSTHF